MTDDKARAVGRLLDIVFGLSVVAEFVQRPNERETIYLDGIEAIGELLRPSRRPGAAPDLAFHPDAFDMVMGPLVGPPFTGTKTANANGGHCWFKNGRCTVCGDLQNP